FYRSQFLFFQAEDGIRFFHVTGVQTCALPISETPCLADMIRAYNELGGNHIAVSPVPDDQTHIYGIVGVKDVSAPVSEVTCMIEIGRASCRERQRMQVFEWNG